MASLNARHALLPALLVLGLAGCDDGPSEPGPAGPLAELIFLGGPVLTIEDGVAEALAVTGNEIVAVGTEEEVLRHEGEETRRVELGGSTLLPGFIDGHTHMLRQAGRQGLTKPEAVEIAIRHGYTTLAELAQHRGGIDDLLALEASGEMRLRVVAYGDYNLSRPGEDGGSLFVGTWFPGNPPLADPDRKLRITGVKVFVDGAFSNDRGCYALTDPYPEAFRNDPGFPDCPDRGSLIMASDELADVIVDAENAGFRVAMHAIGDRALDHALDALEEAGNRTGAADPGHQIQHGFLMRPDQMERIRAMEVPFSVFPNFHTCDQEYYPYYFGEDRYDWYAHRFELAEAGGRAFIETDFNFSTHPDEERFFNRPIDPLVNLWALRTHKEIRRGSVCEPDPWLASHPVSVETGLRMYTLAGARAHGIDHLVGSLRPGKRADLVVLSGDPTAVEPDALPDLRVRMTMIDGRVEYCADDCPIR